MEGIYLGILLQQSS